MSLFSLFLGLAIVFSPLVARGDGFPNTLQNRDFLIFSVEGEENLESPLPADSPLETCRENIAKVVCLVEPAEKGQKPLERLCLKGSEKYAVPFERLFDSYPPQLQRMFCSLRRLFVEKSFFGTAYAGSIKEEDKKSDGAIMGIRRSVIDENLDLSTWASWKEQLSFGGVSGEYRPLPDLPLIAATSRGPANDFLYFVVAHEFGHLFDFANDLNATKSCRRTNGDEDEVCEMAEGSWGALSWLTNKTARPENEFPSRSSLCFYWCEGKTLPRTSVAEVYESLSRTSFISTYATTQPWDDFADSLAYYLSFRNIRLSYLLETRQGSVYDIGAKLRSPLFAAKFEYIRNFLSRRDIIYP